MLRIKGLCEYLGSTSVHNRDNSNSLACDIIPYETKKVISIIIHAVWFEFITVKSFRPCIVHPELISILVVGNRDATVFRDRMLEHSVTRKFIF